jgi:hypothetical protein
MLSLLGGNVLDGRCAPSDRHVRDSASEVAPVMQRKMSAPFETKTRFPRQLFMERDLDKRKQEALAVVSLSTATLIVSFSMALALL